MQAPRSGLVALALSTTLLAPLAAGSPAGGGAPTSPNWTLEAELSPPGLEVHSGFGYALALSGDLLVVGDFNFDHSGFADAGAALVFQRQGNTWIEQARLASPDPSDDDGFGSAVAIHGDTIAVAEPGDDAGASNAGALHVFVRNGTQWVHQARLDSPTPADNGYFGIPALEGGTLVVGARGETTAGVFGAGAAHVFTRTAGTWSLQANLTSSRPLPYGRIGRAVSLSGDTVLLGGQFAPFVFTRQGGVWSEETVLLSPPDLPPALYGLDVAVSGDTAAVRGRGKSSYLRFVVVYRRVGSTWVEEHRVGPLGYDLVDDSFDLDGDTLVVAMNGWQTPGFAGIVEVYVRQGGAWRGPERLNAEYELGFGMGIAVEGNVIAVGNPFEGLVRVYRR